MQTLGLSIMKTSCVSLRCSRGLASRLILGGALSVLIACGGADAADLLQRMPTKAPVAEPQYDWTGWYAGLHAGYAWSPGDVNFASTDLLFGPGQLVGVVPTSLAPNMRGFTGGVQAGYNFQSNWVVAGIEADISYSGLKGDTTAALGPEGVFFNGFLHLIWPAVTTTQEQRLNWFGTLRGRLGALVTPEWLLYATGGAAFGGAQASTNIVVPGQDCAQNAFCAAGSTSSARVGWTVGGGTELAVGPRWTVKAEYLYYDLGTACYDVHPVVPFPGSDAIGLHATAKFTGQIARLGLNYRF
jgi:outer membrane immunogenic protein